MFVSRRLATVAALVAMTGFCLALLAARIVVSGKFLHSFMAWNLLLAWIPFLCALWLYDRYRRDGSWLLIFVLGLAWLAFLPNAPYIVTDLIHLEATPGPIPLWFDAVFFVTAAWTGLLLGLVSLYLVQSVVRVAIGLVTSWLFVGFSFVLCAFGIYLGRFQRFNSWEIVSNPRSIAHFILDRAAHPVMHPRAIAVTVLFTGLLAASYLVFYAFVDPKIGAQGLVETRGRDDRG